MLRHIMAQSHHCHRAKSLCLAFRWRMVLGSGNFVDPEFTANCYENRRHKLGPIVAI